MTKFDDAFIAAGELLSIPGVETIIPDEVEHSIIVLISSSSLLLSDLIPDSLLGFSVSMLYVQGLSVNHKNLMQAKNG